MSETAISSQLLYSKLAAVRRRHLLVWIASGAALGVSYLILALALGMFIDWWIELPMFARMALLVLHLVVLGAIVARFVIHPLIFGPDQEQAALWVERDQPEFRTRLIASVQLGRPGAVETGTSAALVMAMIREAELIARPLDFTRVVSLDRLMRLGAAAVLCILFALAGLAVGGETTSDLLQRAMLVPGVEVPRKTRVFVIDGDRVIAQGDTVALTARAGGIVPRVGTVDLEYESGMRQRIRVPASEAQSGHFTATIEHVQESFQYTFRLNDGTSERHRVEVLVRPAVTLLECRQVYPAYTGMGTVRRSPGDLSLLMGSRLGVNVTVNRPLASAQAGTGGAPASYVYLHGAELKVPLVADPDDPARLSARNGSESEFLVPPETRGLSIHLTDEHGITSADPVVYRVDMIRDRDPTVFITWPQRREELATRNARMILGFVAADDIGIGQVRVRYRVSYPQEEPEQGLHGEYFPTRDHRGDSRVRLDPQIRFDWEQGSPMAGIPVDNFSVRWTGAIQAPVSGEYTFRIQHDDGVRVWIDGEQIIDKWDAGVHETTGKARLEEGRLHDIRIDYWESTGQAHIRLYWQPPGLPEEIVPERYLHPPAAARRQPVVEAEAGIVELELEEQSPRSLRRRYEWSIPTLDPPPREGAIVEYWIEVKDNNDVTGPGRAESERFVVRVVTEDEKWADLMARLGNYFGEIDSVADQQQEINQRLGTLIHERRSP